VGLKEPQEIIGVERKQPPGGAVVEPAPAATPLRLVAARGLAAGGGPTPEEALRSLLT
jgi:hypothetical protein